MLSHSVTAYMCAAAYLDYNFRTEILNNYIKEKHRALTPSFGVDTQKIIENCIRADTIYLVRDLALSGVLLIFLIVCHFLLNGTSLLIVPGPNMVTRMAVREIAPDNIMAYYALLPLFSLLSIHAKRHRVFSMWHLLTSSMIQNAVALLLMLLFFLLSIESRLGWHWIFFCTAMAIIEYMKNGILRRSILFLKRTDSSTMADLRDTQCASEIEYARQVSEGNVVIYNQASPFVFAGYFLNKWSFTAPIGLANDASKPTELFTVFDLYECLTSTANEIDVTKISSKIRAFIHGEDVRKIPELLPKLFQRPMPYLNISSKEATDFMLHCRPILQIQYNNEDLCISGFFNIRIIGNRFLSIEANYRRLPLLQEFYCRYVDSMQTNRSLHEILGSLTVSFAVTVFSLARAPFALIARLAISIYRRIIAAEDIRRIKHGDPSFCFGALPNIREISGVLEYRRPEQRDEADLYQQIVNNAIIDGIITFLEKRNVDTSTFKASREKIINYGIIVSQGKIEAQNLAVGKKASAQSQISQAKRKRLRAQSQTKTT